MRRHLLKRYLQPHRECLRNLLSASRTESQCLHCKKVCIVALAFVVWQMSIAGVSNIEAFSTSEHKASILRLMGPSRNNLVSPMEGYFSWSLYGFFWLEIGRAL